MEVLTPQNDQQILQQEIKSDVVTRTGRTRFSRLVGRSVLAVGLAIPASAAIDIPSSNEVQALTTFANDYPDMDAIDCNSQYGGSLYNWCKGSPSVRGSSRGYDYRNCTDGAAYWITKYTGEDVRGWGDAKYWNEGASTDGYTVKDGIASNIEPGDIAQSDDGGYGHVGFVTAVTKNTNGSVASVSVAELNKSGNGEYNNVVTYSSRNAAGKLIRYGLNDWDHFIDVNGENKGLNNEDLGGSSGTGGGGGGGGTATGLDTIGAYNPANAWYYLRNTNTTGAADVSLNYGNGTWEPIVGDWDGDGDDTIGTYNSANSTFYLRNSSTTGAADITIQYGNAGWKPIVGDWDGNGTDTIGVYNPANSTFYLRNSNTPGVADVTASFGNSNWIPLAGDWDSNNTDTIGVYDPGTSTFHLKNSNATGPADNTFQYGNIGWKPIIGDWNNNGYDSIGLYNPANAWYYLRQSNSSGAADITANFGNSNWKPLAGDWNNQ